MYCGQWQCWLLLVKHDIISEADLWHLWVGYRAAAESWTRNSRNSQVCEWDVQSTLKTHRTTSSYGLIGALWSTSQAYSHFNYFGWLGKCVWRKWESNTLNFSTNAAVPVCPEPLWGQPRATVVLLGSSHSQCAQLSECEAGRCWKRARSSVSFPS